MVERQIILDTETTGLSPKNGHRIIEVGAIEMIDRQLTGRRFHHYINPERSIDDGAQAVHGITSEFLENKPLFDDIVEELILFLEGSELIIHNAPFDVGFLEHELTLCRKFKPHIKPLDQYCRVTDTLKTARKKHPGQKNNLDALCKRYQVDNKDRTLHGALMDAELLAWVYLAMTGGQNHLFDMHAQKNNKIQAVTDVSFYRTVKEPLTIIEATEEELQAHENFLDYIQEQHCVPALWRQQEGHKIEDGDKQ